MSTLEIILAILGLLGVGSALPNFIPSLFKGLFEFLRGKHQDGITLALAKNQRTDKEIEDYQERINYMVNKWIEVKEEYTKVTIQLGIAEYELEQKNKTIEEMKAELAHFKKISEREIVSD
jgi:peptidoglycan hydrolase CwlO-like protein